MRDSSAVKTNYGSARGQLSSSQIHVSNVILLVTPVLWAYKHDALHQHLYTYVCTHAHTHIHTIPMHMYTQIHTEATYTQNAHIYINA